MAPLPVISNVYRVAMNWTSSDTPLVATNVMHFRKAGTNAAALFTALDANVTAAMWHCQETHSGVSTVVITPLDGSSVSLPVVTGKPSKWSGFQTTHDFNPQVANIIKLLTPKRGRSYRGRLFLPWVAEVVQTFGQLNAGDATATTNAWIAFHTAMTGAGFDFVVASYHLQTADVVAALGCEEYTATQRRRQTRNSSVQ